MSISGRFSRSALAVLLGLVSVAWSAPVLCQQVPITLPKPETGGGMPLMQALAHRKTTRAFREQALDKQTLSNLLWAAFGVNRPRSVMPGMGRTAPSAMNSQDIEIEVVLPQGVYLYDAERNLLRPVVAGDVRGKIGPGAAAHAAVTLVYVAPVNDRFAQVDVGFIGQNVYLFAASERLNAWFYVLHGQEAAATLKLASDRQLLYGQSVGYPPR